MDEATRTITATDIEPHRVSAGGRATVWERWSFSCVRAFLRLHKAAWGLRGLYLMCRFFGTLEYLVNHKRRRRVRAMLEQVYDRQLVGAGRHHIIREHFMRQRCDKVFCLIFDTLSIDQVRGHFEIVNRKLIDDGLARGKGVYALLCHHGAHHVVGMAMSALGYRVAGIRDPNEGAVQRFLQDLWIEKHPDLPRAKVLYSSDFVRQIYRLFAENWALGSALDVTRVRDGRLKTTTVTIFGGRREFLTGTLQIALRCRAYVIQAFVVSLPDFHYRLEFVGPMSDPQSDAESPELLSSIMQRYADNVAEYARRYPDHITRV